MKRWQWLALGTIGIIVIALNTKRGQQFATEAYQSVKNLGVRLVATLEGFSAVPYQDEAGLWTIGYGHLIRKGDPYYHPVFNPDGVREITQEQAEAQLDADMGEARRSVANRVTVPLSEQQNAALVSLVFNIGDGNFSTSTLLTKLNAGDYEGAAAEFPKWNKVRNASNELVVSNGLVNRREQEQRLFMQA